MRTIVGNLWDQDGWIVIPTNLTIKKNGEAVMGRGVAKQAVDQYPWLPGLYGKSLAVGGRVMIDYNHRLVLFPVKHRWHQKADVKLIEESLTEMVFTLNRETDCVFLPLVGCGFGELSEEEVRPLLDTYLDDRFTLVLRDEETTRRYAASLRPGVRVDRSYKA